MGVVGEMCQRQPCRTLEVMIAVKVQIDDQFPASDHVKDIVANARRLFSVAEVTLVKSRIGSPPASQ